MSTATTTSENEPEDEPVHEPSDDTEALSLAIEMDRRDRRWIAALTKLLKTRISPSGCHRSAADVPMADDLSPRVQRSLDDVVEAACGRLCRIINSDIDTDTQGDS